MIDTTGKAFLGKGWAFPVQFDKAGQVTEAVYEEDIRQAVLLILNTEPGERVMRPDFGAGLRSLVFEPISAATRALVKYRTERALITWEPRVDNLEVTVNVDAQMRNKLLVEIRYRVRATNTFYNLVYPFYLQEGRP